MGVENNEVVIATTWDNEAVDLLKLWIAGLHTELQQLFAIIPSIVNDKTTIVLGPDGSKKGWNTAEKGDLLRKHFIDQIEKMNYEDNTNPFDWIEVGYGEFGQKVLRGNCENRYSNDEYYVEK